MAKNYKKSEDQIKKELPKKGRNGDDVLAHLTKGEIVVPVEILDAEDGYLRQIINEVMKELGGNPNEYTVGHKDNKINPETGYPEFWGWNPFKAVKKIVSSVKKVVKKVIAKVSSVFSPKMPEATEAPSTGASSYSASNQDSGNEQDAEVKKKSAALRRKRRGKRRLRINSGTEVGTTGSGSGVNAGSGSGVNVPKG
jgi:hypothetical protein